MDREEFYLLNQAYNKRVGRSNVMYGESYLGKHTKIISNELMRKGYVAENGEATVEGIRKLEPYKVDNAVILAAGAATRFVPLSLEKPKGLYEVRNECIIERQIKQLKSAGINDITLVLGYKKEMFFYLKDKYGVKFIFNNEYNSKNNTYSLFLAKDELKNTYICSSDDYFVQNPFQRYEYGSFYAGYHVDKKTNEMYVTIDDNMQITKMAKGLDRGNILMGQSFWTESFSNKMVSLLKEDQQVGIYDNMFWEWVVKDNLTTFPILYFKLYSPEEIFEFDYFSQLRDFDNHYVDSSHSKIMERIKLIFRCDEEDVVDFRNISEGMTNTSFIFKIDGVDYIYRYPGNGTNKIINRKNEKNSLKLAHKLGIDPTYIYSDTNEGWKISKLIHSFREPNYHSKQDSSRVIKVLQKLHAADVKVDYGMKPWEDACKMEKLLKENDANSFSKFEPLKQKIKKLYDETQGDGIKKCFCHGDTYKHNWMIRENGDTLLIDWEYSGMSDPGIDVGYYIVDAMYDFNDAESFIKEYLDSRDNPQNEFHFMAYTAIIAYYWFVWALYRESCGAVMGESLYNWYKMAEKYADYLLN
ncbi:phosphotransferase [Limosilactobacillus reuteri]|uniref:phosphotransferase n=1 Tax=Limosilactobacillus reuteri TaxID=1598 RepID=UPI001F4D86B4|nr:phosphotransferase [Limosilactobacillus reuteri]MCH9394800.1 phosphotransferase [Limosilactobacillus reuteri]